ncbi:hypothetical protein [Rhodoferax sp.]|nr:hypothetical protein [Rhodoferax sp.]MDP2440042.1 hypothetical protein [Rhodoferax sp.]
MTSSVKANWLIPTGLPGVLLTRQMAHVVTVLLQTVTALIILEH